jgi:hypothetical protein
VPVSGTVAARCIELKWEKGERLARTAITTVCEWGRADSILFLPHFMNSGWFFPWISITSANARIAAAQRARWAKVRAKKGAGPHIALESLYIAAKWAAPLVAAFGGVWAGGPAFGAAGIRNTEGALSFRLRSGQALRALCEGRVLRTPAAAQPMPPDLERKSRSIPHSPAPFRPLAEDRNDNCSSAIVRALPPVLVSPDCDACTSTSLRASWSSIR